MCRAFPTEYGNMSATRRTAKAARATVERQRAIQAAIDHDAERKPASKKATSNKPT